MQQQELFTAFTKEKNNMKRSVICKGETIEYNLCYKKVKNINLRIKADGSLYVSAARFVPLDIIDNFIKSKYEFINNAKKKLEETKMIQPIKYYDEDSVKEIILSLCKDVYPYFKKQGFSYPQIKFRKMTSQWGNCRASKMIITFNTNLMYAPYECIEYVVIHEFVHLLQQNHSPKFYEEVEKLMPDWKERRRKLKQIPLYKN